MNATRLRKGMMVALKGPGYTYRNPAIPKYEKATVIAIDSGRSPHHLVEFQSGKNKGSQIRVTSRAIVDRWTPEIDEQCRDAIAQQEANDRKIFQEEVKVEMANEKMNQLAPLLQILAGLEDVGGIITRDGSRSYPPRMELPLVAVEKLVWILQQHVSLGFDS